MSATGATGRIDTHDVIEHNEATDLWDVTLRQLSPGPFQGRVDYAQVGGLLFYREQWNQRILANGASPAGYYVFGGSVPSAETVDWCGGKANREQLAFGTPSSEMEIVFPDVSSHLALLVPQHLMQHHFGEELVATAQSSQRHHLTGGSHRGSDLLARLDYMINKFQANPALLANASECKAAEIQLMDDLAEFFADFYTGDQHVTVSQRRKTLQRAFEYSEQLREPISVPAFAAATGMSQRTLELAFQEALGITPRQFLHRHRMNSAHRELLASDAESAMTTKIAAQWGFTELGRFSVEYKTLYGESPSVTLHRRKRSPPMRLSDALI